MVFKLEGLCQRTDKEGQEKAQKKQLHTHLSLAQGGFSISWNSVVPEGKVWVEVGRDCNLCA